MSFLTRLALAGKKQRHVRTHDMDSSTFCCGEKKAGPIGTNLLGILVLLSCNGVCETRNVQSGNCFGLFGTRALRALDLVDNGFSQGSGA